MTQPSPLAVVQLLLAKYHAEATAPLAAQLHAALERIAQLEAQVQQLRTVSERGHRGTYQPGALYERGEEVAFGGSTWRALVDDPAEPPPNPECWRLIAQGRRSGAAGKALRRV